MANADRIIELLHEAKARPAGAERERFIAEACGADAALKEQIVSLLNADAKEGDSDFLKNTLLLRPTALVTEKPGDRIGRYKLLEQIGEGGCGVVYMADQEDPVRRRVALKVIKLGMDTRQVIARFEAERQALALMDHPNIAKVLDGGATDTGRPFFVMELVRGIKITDYCDQNNLSTNERLELFIQVCQAIQHAHQKGIIHRDIKPSNILVTQHDDVAVPKVIDFGIAKATTGQLTDKTVFTAFAQFIGTPAYMSPEQAQMSGLDVDTRADIYSLGVLLYELLTGNTPFDAKELLAAGMDEMRRKIREDEPAKPSTSLSTMQAMDLTMVAKRRHVEPPKLIHLIRGDLDWLVMKCLEKDRTRRYETANGLGLDIQRHLRNEPVVARPPSNLYRFQKLVRRNKLAFAAVSAVLLVLLIGIAASTWQAIRATRAEHEQTRLREQAENARNNEARERAKAEANEKRAESEAAKSGQVSTFLKDMLKGVSSDVALGRDTTMLREVLDKTVERIGTELKDQPEVEGELLNVSGWTYCSIRESAKAEAAFRRALVVQRKLLGDNLPDLADSLFGLGQVLNDEGKPEESEASYRESLEIRRKVYGNEHWTVAACLNNLTAPLVAQGKLAEAESYSREALAMKRKLFANDHPEVAISLRDLGLILRTEGKLAEAERLLREGLATFRRTVGDLHPDVAFTLGGLAGVLSREGYLAEAETAGREAMAIQKKLYGGTNSLTAGTLASLTLTLLYEKKSEEAEPFARELLALDEKMAPDHWYKFSARNFLGAALLGQKKYAEAEPLLLSAYEGMKQREDKIPANDKVRLQEAIQSLVQLYEETGQSEKAAEWNKKLAEFDKAGTEQKTAASKP
ncbi:MAG TPA: serine/threonine-protein kinase [Candidatus Dormibacteraeota bacterium]|nr:serine/threonine-protein kinase [Candidatus Dormibacteraeota bacterium]